MVRTPCAEIVCVIDRSGSMDAIRSDAVGGFNRFLEEQKKLPGDARLTLVLFNHEYGLVADGAPLSSIKPLSDETYVPSGTTALLDAVGRTLDAVRARIDGMTAAARPDRVIVSILTDGLENASRDYTYERIGRMIAECRKKRGWDFVFLAANQDAFATGRALSIAEKDVVQFAATPEGIKDACCSINTMVTESRTKRGRRGDARQ
jgi:Mg-chelatase subunit ChlD